MSGISTVVVPEASAVVVVAAAAAAAVDVAVTTATAAEAAVANGAAAGLTDPAHRVTIHHYRASATKGQCQRASTDVLTDCRKTNHNLAVQAGILL